MTFSCYPMLQLIISFVCLDQLIQHRTPYPKYTVSYRYLMINNYFKLRPTGIYWSIIVFNYV